MSLLRIGLLACLLISGGCSSYARLERLQVDLAQELSRGRDEEAGQLEKRIAAIATNAYGKTDPETFRIRTQVAEIYGSWRRTDHALALATSARTEMEAVYGPQDERITMAMLAEARTHVCARRWNDAEQTIDRIAGLCHQAFAHSSAHPACRSLLGVEIVSLYGQTGANRKAVEQSLYAESAGLLAEEEPEHDVSGAVSLLTVFGRRLAENGDYPEALWYLERCVEESRKRDRLKDSSSTKGWSISSGDVELFVTDSAHSFHSQSPRCLEDVIALRRKTGDDETATRLAAWQRERWSHGPDVEAELVERAKFADEAWKDDAWTSRYTNDLAFYYAGKGRPLDAIAAYEDAIRRLDRGHGRDQRMGRCDSDLLLDELLGLGAAFEEAGRNAEAEAAYARAVQVAETDLHPAHAWRLETVARLARVLARSGRTGDAEQMWRRYLLLARRMRGNAHADVAFGLAGLAAVLQESGSIAEAEASRREAASIWGSYAHRIASVRDLPLPLALRSPPSPAN